MNMESFVELIRELLIFVVVMFALLIALIVVVSKMPDDNPLKRILSALSYRLGATAAAGTLAIPIEPIPGFDTLWEKGHDLTTLGADAVKYLHDVHR
jgi:hypothetical protein